MLLAETGDGCGESVDLRHLPGRLEGVLGASMDDTTEDHGAGSRPARQRDVGRYSKALAAKIEASPKSHPSTTREGQPPDTVTASATTPVQHLAGWRGSDEFCGFYPFPPTSSILPAVSSPHGVFTGVSLGGRASMLAVFQEVAKALREDVGHLALRLCTTALPPRSARHQTHQMAERHSEAVASRSKAMFLLKWVREFKATPRNVAILLIDRPDIDIERKGRSRPLGVESQSPQRNGDSRVPPDAEKDIEVESRTQKSTRSMATLVGSVQS